MTSMRRNMSANLSKYVEVPILFSTMRTTTVVNEDLTSNRRNPVTLNILDEHLMATQNTKPPKLTRKCRRCKKYRTLKDFETHHHKTCIPCQITIRLDAVRVNEHTGKLEPKPTGPALTSTVEGRNKYERDRKRALAGSAKPPAVMPTTKLCRRCQTRKPLSEFGSWRIRVCLACDGPTLDSLLRR